MEQDSKVLVQNFNIRKLFGFDDGCIFILDMENLELVIQRPKKMHKQIRVNLKYYYVKWIGIKKKQFCFNIKRSKSISLCDAKNNSKKSIVACHEQESVAQEWFNQIQLLIQKKDQQDKYLINSDELQDKPELEQKSQYSELSFNFQKNMDEQADQKQLPKLNKINMMCDDFIDFTDFAQSIAERIASNEPILVNSADKRRHSLAIYQKNSFDDQSYWNISLAESIYYLDQKFPRDYIKFILHALETNVQTLNCLSYINNFQQQQRTVIYDYKKMLAQRFYQVQQDHQLYFSNPDLLKAQRNVLQTIIKNIAINIFQGRSIMNQSLPVTVFEPKTFLDRVAEQFSYLPVIMDKIKQDFYFSSNTDNLTIMKYLACYITSAVIFSTGQFKPFNPVLGETKQLIIHNINVDLEQISHHPPVSGFYMKTSQFTHFGQQITDISHYANSLVVRQVAPHHFLINGNKYSIFWPESKILNTLIGQRKQIIIGQGYVFDLKNNIIGQLNYKKENENFSDTNLQDIISVQFMKMKQDTIQKYYKKQQPVKQSDIQENLDQIQGHYLSKIYSGDKVFFDFSQETGYGLMQQPYPLPSDSIFRKDMLYLKQGDLINSQTQKENIEEEERVYQKLRKKRK